MIKLWVAVNSSAHVPCWWNSKVANSISKIDDYVKHIFREHNQEADRWANLRAEGQKNHC